MKLLKLTFITLLTFGITTGLQAQISEVTENEVDYSSWDTDADGNVDELEFEVGLEDEGLFTDYDANEDDIWDDEEYQLVLEEEEWLGDDELVTWDLDGDGAVYKDEFYDRIYDTWNEDDNEWLDEDEFEDNWAR